ncbi:MAG: hypothetical protein ACR2Q4_13835 [Geminicoccaceae bacterium]
MLAGRSAASGQLGHARAVLAQTERLLADRAHNRLNPVEREEFFEQVARLRLTISDAESEAEVQAAEHEAAAPPPVPVNRERLKELALALTGPAEAATEQAEPGASASVPDDQLAEQDPPTEPLVTTDDVPVPPSSSDGSGVAAKKSADPNQLRLPRQVAERVTIEPDRVKADTVGRRRRAKPGDTSTARKILKPVEPIREEPDTETAVRSTSTESQAASRQKLPKGWVIDDDGFVVPGTSN